MAKAKETRFLVTLPGGGKLRGDAAASYLRMRADGIHVVSTEMVIFEWLHRAATDDFRALLPLLR